MYSCCSGHGFCARYAFGFLDLWFDFFPFARTMHDAWTNLMHMLLVFQNLSDLSTVVDSILQWPMDDKVLKSTVEFTLAECFFTKEAWSNSWFVRRHSLNLKRCPQVKRLQKLLPLKLQVWRKLRCPGPVWNVVCPYHGVQIGDRRVKISIATRPYKALCFLWFQSFSQRPPRVLCMEIWQDLVDKFW